MNDERRRTVVAEEVAEAEAVINLGLERYDAIELEAMNQQLEKLRNEAASLKMPSRRIDQLKLEVAAAMAGGRNDGPGPMEQQGPGPRGFEKVTPVQRTPAEPETTEAQPQPDKAKPLDRRRAISELFGE